MTDETPGDRLRLARRDAGMSTAELGERAAVVAKRAKPISASAVRNQENGTNGIPWALITAYATVLGVSSQWLLFGQPFKKDDVPARQFGSQEEEPEEEDELSAIEIQVVGPITDNWDEWMPLNPTQDDPHGYLIHVDVAGYWDTTLQAHLVADHSLMPAYAKGTYLICAPEERTGVREGDHLVVVAFDEENAMRRTIRQVRRAKGAWGAVDLVPVGESRMPRISWFGPGAFSAIYPDGVVVATYRPISPETRGRLVTLPPELQLEPDEQGESPEPTPGAPKESR